MKKFIKPEAVKKEDLKNRFLHLPVITLSLDIEGTSKMVSLNETALMKLNISENENKRIGMTKGYVSEQRGPD